MTRYLGVHLSEDLTNKTHFIKRRAAAFASYSRMVNFGFTTTDSEILFKAKMYKTYIRLTLLYGLETCYLSKSDLKQLKATEGNIIKKLLNVYPSCHNKHLFNN